MRFKMTTTKTCHKCKRNLPLEDFYKSSSSKDGYAPSCKDCQWGSPLGTRTSRVGDVEVPKANVNGLIPTEEPHGINTKCSTKSEKNTKKEYQKAKKLTAVAEETPNPANMDSNVVYTVPMRKNYHGSFDWDQVYGRKKCSICHQYYKEGDQYAVIGMHLDTIITCHEMCRGKS
jgi:hypothetical protein